MPTQRSTHTDKSKDKAEFANLKCFHDLSRYVK
jgi:hypothetical protein